MELITWISTVDKNTKWVEATSAELKMHNSSALASENLSLFYVNLYGSK